MLDYAELIFNICIFGACVLTPTARLYSHLSKEKEISSKGSYLYVLDKITREHVKNPQNPEDKKREEQADKFRKSMLSYMGPGEYGKKMRFYIKLRICWEKDGKQSSDRADVSVSWHSWAGHKYGWPEHQVRTDELLKNHPEWATLYDSICAALEVTEGAL